MYVINNLLHLDLVDMSVIMSVVSKMRRRNYVDHAHAQSHFLALKTDL